MQRIDTDSHIEEALDALVRLDPRLGPVRDRAGLVPLRRRAPGFESLAEIIVAQQVSRASADAIFARLTGLVSPLSAVALLAAGEDVFRQAGLSRPKQRTLLALAQAIADGLDLEELCGLDAAHSISRLTGVSGIGPWTAEVYLLACAGHPDVFPARDVALQAAVGHAFAMEERPDAKSLARLAESWAPLRAVAARLFWAYYREMKGREAAPAA
jgi:DNA-3-methyladenine glycosylase II